MHAPCTDQLANILKEQIGDATEAVAFVNGHACLALLDTGSQITSIAISFYERHLPDQPIQPVEDIVRVVGAGGTVTIDVGFPKDEIAEGPLKTLALVVPNNNYNQRVPVIIGTNLVKQCMDECQRVAGQRFLETANISSKWKRVYQFIQSQERFTSQHENGNVSEEGDDLSSLFDLDDTLLSTEQKERTFAMLKKMSHVFARDQNDLVCAEAVEQSTTMRNIWWSVHYQTIIEGPIYF